MKRQLLQFMVMTVVLVLLCGMQSSFYLLPIPAPALWFIVFSYYSYNKPLLTALLLNLLLTVILLNFSVGNAGVLLGTLNFSTLIMKILKNRLHIGNMQNILTSGIGCFLYFFLLWATNRFFNGLYYPNVLGWLGTSVVTLAAAPFVIWPLSQLEKFLLTEKVDTLQDLVV